MLFSGEAESPRGDKRATVRESGVPGAGLGAFARRAFRKGATVGPYRCKMVATAALDENVTRSREYTWVFNATH